jgi:hypothetical protein
MASMCGCSLGSSATTVDVDDAIAGLTNCAHDHREQVLAGRTLVTGIAGRKVLTDVAQRGRP